MVLKGFSRLIKVILALTLAFMLFPSTGSAGIAPAGPGPSCSNYSFDAVLAHPEKVLGVVIEVDGYAKITEDGYILYYSYEDYLYDTRENSIYVQERKGYDITEYFENCLLVEYEPEKNTQEDGF